MYKQKLLTTMTGIFFAMMMSLNTIAGTTHDKKPQPQQTTIGCDEGPGGRCSGIGTVTNCTATFPDDMVCGLGKANPTRTADKPNNLVYISQMTCSYQSDDNYNCIGTVDAEKNTLPKKTKQTVELKGCHGRELIDNC